jgi:hypothetical protein
MSGGDQHCGRPPAAAGYCIGGLGEPGACALDLRRLGSMSRKTVRGRGRAGTGAQSRRHARSRQGSMVLQDRRTMVAYLSGTPGQVTCAGTVLPGAPGAGSKKNGSVASPGRMGWLHFGQIAMSSVGSGSLGSMGSEVVGSGSLGSAVWEVGGGPGLLGGALADESASLGRASSASLRRAHSNSFAMLRGVLMPAAYSTCRSAPERAFDRDGTRTPARCVATPSARA